MGRSSIDAGFSIAMFDYGGVYMLGCLVGNEGNASPLVATVHSPCLFPVISPLGTSTMPGEVLTCSRHFETIQTKHPSTQTSPASFTSGRQELRHGPSSGESKMT